MYNKSVISPLCYFSILNTPLHNRTFSFSKSSDVIDIGSAFLSSFFLLFQFSCLKLGIFLHLKNFTVQREIYKYSRNATVCN